MGEHDNSKKYESVPNKIDNKVDEALQQNQEIRTESPHEEKSGIETVKKEVAEQSPVSKEEKGNKKEEKVEKHHSSVAHKPKADDEIPITFSLIKEKAASFMKDLKGREKKKVGKENNKEGAFDAASVLTWSKKNARWLIPVFCIIIAIFVSSYFRMMPSSLPVTDEWAENSVQQFYRQQIENQISQQYPNLPQQNRDVLVEREVQRVFKENKEILDQQIADTSQQLKAQIQDENGDTYLLAIDPYLWYSQARNVLEHGHLGDTLIDGEAHFSLRDGRLSKRSSTQLHPYVGAYLYKFLAIFNSDITLMRAIWLLPVIIIALAIIPIFFIGRKIGGNVGGFFAALFLAVNGPLLSRTPGGFSDTDVYNIFFPLFAVWFFMESYTAKETSKQIGFAVLAGLTMGIFAAAWSGWSYAFWIIIAAQLMAIGAVTIVTWKEQKFAFSKELFTSRIKKQFLTLGLFFISSGIFVSLFQSFYSFSSAFTRLFKFTQIKAVGVKSIWPNVLTTVAEFNTTSFGNIINQLGGNLFVFIAVVGIVLALLKREKQEERIYIYALLLVIWLGATAYAFTKGIRFAILAAPPFALALGAAVGGIYYRSSTWLSKQINLDEKISKVVILVVLALLLVTPFSSAKDIAKNQLPSMNDAWYEALTKIKEESADAIITSWWDFGHWFVAVAERRVTFDGGDQGDRIHWVGRSLQTNNEQEAIGILRMLNCRQELAPHKLEEFLNNNDSLEAVEKIKEAILLPPEGVQEYYQELGLTNEEVKEMIAYTHCEDLIPNYYITSEDMVGKSGVWGHFGAWDFRKAAMYQSTRNMKTEQAVPLLMERFGLTEQEAIKTHTEIKTEKADNWIAPWPGYITGFRSCENTDENSIRCDLPLQGGYVGVNIDTNIYNVRLEGNDEIKPDSIVYVTEEGVEEKKFEGQNTGFSVVVAPQGDGYKAMLADPLQAQSMFTRLFFLDGHGLQCFSKFDDRRQFTNQKIITWKVDFDCMQENKVFSMQGVEETTGDTVNETALNASS